MTAPSPWSFLQDLSSICWGSLSGLNPHDFLCSSRNSREISVQIEWTDCKIQGEKMVCLVFSLKILWLITHMPNHSKFYQIYEKGWCGIWMSHLWIVHCGPDTKSSQPPNGNRTITVESANKIETIAILIKSSIENRPGWTEQIIYSIITVLCSFEAETMAKQINPWFESSLAAVADQCRSFGRGHSSCICREWTSSGHEVRNQCSNGSNWGVVPFCENHISARLPNWARFFRGTLHFSTWRFPKMVPQQNHPNFSGIFHEINHPAIKGNPPFIYGYPKSSKNIRPGKRLHSELENHHL